MAHHKGQGSSRNGRDSKSKRLGVKRFEGQPVRSGTIIVRQRGSQWVQGFNVSTGRDFTLFATLDGLVKFESGKRVSVYPVKAAAPAPAAT